MERRCSECRDVSEHPLCGSCCSTVQDEGLALVAWCVVMAAGAVLAVAWGLA